MAKATRPPAAGRGGGRHTPAVWNGPHNALLGELMHALSAAERLADRLLFDLPDALNDEFGGHLRDRLAAVAVHAVDNRSWIDSARVASDSE